jgi:hypothetical protein
VVLEVPLLFGSKNERQGGPGNLVVDLYGLQEVNLLVVRHALAWLASSLLIVSAFSAHAAAAQTPQEQYGQPSCRPQ